MELQSMELDPDARMVRSMTLEPVPLADARRLRRLLARQPRNEPASDETQATVSELIDSLGSSDWLGNRSRRRSRDEIVAAGSRVRNELAQPGTPRPACDALIQLLASLERDPSSQDTLTTDSQPPQGARHVDLFVLALPLEQLAYYVNRTTMLTFLAPELRDVIHLSRHMDWMAGIQFYLSVPLDIAPGHIVGLDSNWALTAVEHTQFWDDIDLPNHLQGVLSVDISAWDKRGRTIRKEAYNCSDQEIATEVWAQLKEMLNARDRVDVLRDDMLVGGAIVAGRSYNIDDSIVDLRDRKKQAFYERARSLKFSTLPQTDEGEPSTTPNASGFDEKVDE